MENMKPVRGISWQLIFNSVCDIYIFKLRKIRWARFAVRIEKLNERDSVLDGNNDELSHK